MKISVVIPYYNQPKYIGHAIDSILSQGATPFEVIIVNDGSDEDIPQDVVDRVKDIPLHIVEHEHNQGIADARNSGIVKSSGDAIAFLSADDEWEDNFLEESIKVMNNTNADVVYSDYSRINKDSVVTRAFREFHPKSHSAFCIHAWKRCPAMFSGILIKKNVFAKVMFKPGLRYGEDYLWLLKAMKHFKFQHIPLLLARYRVHPEQTTKLELNNIPKNDEKIKQEARRYWYEE